MSARQLGRILCVPIWLVVAALLTLVVARVVAFDRLHLFMLADAFTPWIYLPAYAIVVAALLFRYRTLAVAAAVIVVAQLVWVLTPVFDTVDVPAAASSAPRLRVVSSNLEFTNHDETLIDEIAGFDADVIVLEEVTPAWWHAVRSRGLLASYPHHAESISGGASGMAILSRTPLDDVRVHDVDGLPVITATVTIAGRALHVVGVHPVAPVDSFPRYRRQQRLITALLRDVPRPRIVAGDFNSTMYNKWMTELGDLGLHEAHDAVGRPFATTWPNGKRLVPPVRIDHVLFDPPLVVLDASEGEGSGADHRPIVVDLAVLPTEKR